MIDHGGISEQGPVRKRNEDYIGHGPSDDIEPGHHKGKLYIVCDGVGGSGAGDVASREAVQTVLHHYYTIKKKPHKALLDAIDRTNLHVYDISMKADRRRMETTIVALAIVGHKAYIVNIGDTRAYRVRNKTEIELLSTDHSEVAEMVKMRLITLEQARHNPRRNIITRSMGSQPMVSPAVRTEHIEHGDTFILCTDGLWEPVSDEEMAEIVSTHPAQEACRIMTDLAISRGSNDNVSVQVITVNEIDKETSMHLPIETSWWSKVSGVFGGAAGKK